MEPHKILSLKEDSKRGRWGRIGRKQIVKMVDLKLITSIITLNLNLLKYPN